MGTGLLTPAQTTLAGFKFTESDAFKSELMLRTSRWARDRVPASAFGRACLEAGLSQEDTDKLTGSHQCRQNGKYLVQRTTRLRRGATFDGVIRAAGLMDDDGRPSELGEPSEGWSPKIRRMSFGQNAIRGRRTITSPLSMRLDGTRDCSELRLLLWSPGEYAVIEYARLPVEGSVFIG